MLLLFPVPDGVPVRLLGRSTPVSPGLTPVSCLDTVVLFRTAVLSSAKKYAGMSRTVLLLGITILYGLG